MSNLKNLELNWDSYGAPPIDSRIIDAAVRIAELLRNPPAIVPTSSGGVQLEWHALGIDFEIEITTPMSAEASIDWVTTENLIA